MKETEAIFRQLQNYLEANDLDPTPENIDRFMKDYNAGKIRNLSIDPESRSYEYLEEFEKAEDRKEAKRLLQRALEIYPHNYDAAMQLIFMESQQPNIRLKRLYHLKEEADKRLEDTGLLQEKGHFYQLQGTRPYMRLCHAIMELENGTNNIDGAIKAAEHIIEYNNNDNMGVRYVLSGLYLAKRDFASFEKLWKRYPREISGMCIMDKAIAASMQGNDAKYKRYLRQLKDVNPFLYLYFACGDNDVIVDERFDSYAFGGIEEANVYLEEHAPLLTDEVLDALPFVKGASIDDFFTGDDDEAMILLFADEHSYDINNTDFFEKDLLRHFNHSTHMSHLPKITITALRKELEALRLDGYLYCFENGKGEWRITTRGTDMAYIYRMKLERILDGMKKFKDLFDH